MNNSSQSRYKGNSKILKNHFSMCGSSLKISKYNIFIEMHNRYLLPDVELITDSVVRIFMKCIYRDESILLQ